MFSRSIIFRSLEIIIAAVFIYAGALKALDPAGFANDIDNYKILPWAISVRLAFYLPWLEIFCGVALITRRFHFGALAVLTSLMSIFIIASLVAKARGLDISCGCFGHASKNWSFTTHLVLDIGLLAGLVLLARDSWRNLGLGSNDVSVRSESIQRSGQELDVTH
jgi:putative oxidoreductase